MTSDPADIDTPEPIEVNQSVPCEIYGVRYSRLAGSPTPRVYATLTFDAVAYRRLGGLLGANLKGTVTMHVLDIQAPLDDDDDDDDFGPSVPSNQLPLAPTAEETEVVDMIVNGEPAKVRRQRRNGSVNGSTGWVRHRFADDPDPEKVGLCGNCHKRLDDDIHDVAPWSAEAPELHAFRPGDDDASVCRWCNGAAESPLHGDPEKQGEELTPLASKLLADLQEPVAEAVEA